MRRIAMPPSMRSSSRVWAAVTLAAAAALGPVAAQGTVVVRRSLPELASAADLVLVGRVQQRAGRLVGGRVFTDVQIAVETVVRGSARPTTVVVRLPGGVVGGIGQHLAGAPVLSDGARYVLFLRARGATYETLGLAQGALRVADDAAQTVSPADTSGLEWANGPAAPAIPPSGLALRELLRRL